MNERTVRAVASPTGIVADDLTGAMDSAVQFAGAGWKTKLALTMPLSDSVERGSVTAFVTDARAKPATAANDSTATAVSGLLASGIERLFVKIDSTLRGSVIHQVHGALAAWSSQHPDPIAIVCSAYPAMGRTIENGRMLVNGHPVHTTAIARDPVTPMITSDLVELLPGSVGFRLSEGTAAENAARLEAAADGIATKPSVIAADATTDDDLARLAQAVELLSARAVPVGAAGLAGAMAAVWAEDSATSLDVAGSSPTDSSTVAAVTVPDSSSGRRVIVVVSSLHDVSRAQVEQLMCAWPSDQVRTFEPPLDEALNVESIADWTRQELAKSPALPSVVVISSPSERPAQQRDGDRTAAELIAESLATITDLVFEHDRIDVIFLLGGEGTRAVLGRLGAEALIVRNAVREGIPLASLEGGKAEGVMVITKAGGFGSPTTVTEIVAELVDGNQSTTPG